MQPERLRRRSKRLGSIDADTDAKIVDALRIKGNAAAVGRMFPFEHYATIQRIAKRESISLDWRVRRARRAKLAPELHPRRAEMVAALWATRSVTKAARELGLELHGQLVRLAREEKIPIPTGRGARFVVAAATLTETKFNEVERALRTSRDPTSGRSRVGRCEFK